VPCTQCQPNNYFRFFKCFFQSLQSFRAGASPYIYLQLFSKLNDFHVGLKVNVIEADSEETIMYYRAKKQLRSA